VRPLKDNLSRFLWVNGRKEENDIEIRKGDTDEECFDQESIFWFQ
jgi:hypothetical protein